MVSGREGNQDPRPRWPLLCIITVYIINEAFFPYTAQNHQFDFYERIINFYSFNWSISCCNSFFYKDVYLNLA
jgi:hypothetical protein